LETLYTFLFFFIGVVGLYVGWQTDILPKLKGELTLDELIDEFEKDSILENDCRIISTRDATLKEVLYFQKVRAYYFPIFLFFACIVTAILLDFGHILVSCIIVIVLLILSYILLFKNLKRAKDTGDKKVLHIKGTVRKNNIREENLMTVGKRTYGIPEGFKNPEYGSIVEFEAYEGIYICSLNNRYLLENESLEKLKNWKGYHRTIAYSLLVFLFFFGISYTEIKNDFLVNSLFLKEKNIEYLNAKSIFNNPPKSAQRLHLSGYRLCDDDILNPSQCKNFFILDRDLIFEGKLEIKNIFNINLNDFISRYRPSSEFLKSINSINSYYSIQYTKIINLQKIKEMILELKQINSKEINKKLVELLFLINEIYQNNLISDKKEDVIIIKKKNIFYSKFREEFYNFKIFLFNFEKQRLKNFVSKYIDSMNNKVYINYIENFYYKDRERYDPNISKYENLLNNFNESKRMNNIKVIVSSVEEKIVKNKKDIVINVFSDVDDIDESVLLEFKIYTFLLIFIICAIIYHLFFGFIVNLFKRNR